MDIVCRCGCRESAFQSTAIFWQTDRERFADMPVAKMPVVSCTTACLENWEPEK